MKTIPDFRQQRAKRGSALILTLIISTAMLMLVAGLISVTLTDKRVNNAVATTDEARNAAEGAMEVATAEFDRVALSEGALDDNPLSGYTFPTAMTTALSQHNVVAASIEVVPGSLSPVSNTVQTIDIDDPFNATDPHKGDTVNLRHGYIYGKATALDPRSGRSVTSYLSTLLQVRTQTWLNYGIFGNLDLEFHAGPTMDIKGSVHTNKNIYAVGGSTLKFYQKTTASKKIYRKFKDDGVTTSHTAEVQFPNKSNAVSGDLSNMATNKDSQMTGFFDYATTKWKGFVQDETFEVTPFLPPGMLDYIEDDYTTSGVNETRNYAYALIEPLLSTAATDDPSTHSYAGNKGLAVENLKVAAVASLIIRIKHKPGATPEATWWENIAKQDNDDPLFEPGFELVFHTLEDSSRSPNRTNFPVRDGNGLPSENVIPLSPTRMSPELRNLLFSAVRLVRYDEDTGSALNGNRDLRATQFKVELGGALADSDATLPAYDLATNGRRWYGIYDRRQGYVYGASSNEGLHGAYHALHVDLDEFDKFLNADTDHWFDEANPTELLFNPDVQWSGVLYVQFPLLPVSDAAVSARMTSVTGTPAPDRIRIAQPPTNTTPGYALVLRNGKRLPSFAGRRDDGFVVGTNGPAYVLGHYNSDGSSGTGSATANDPAWDEIPSIIVADAVTLLSQAYADDHNFFLKSAVEKKTAANFTEFSSAVFAGVVPTRLDTTGAQQYQRRMGGMHNFVRFLEDWGGKTYRNRGALAVLFESEIQKRPYFENNHGRWYGAPTRDIGYHTFFGLGQFPKPWPPFLRSTRRIRVDQLSATQYNAGPPTPP